MADRTITHSVTGRVHSFNVKGAGVVVFDEAKASEDNNDHARSHGWKQRISDAAALDKGSTAEQKRAAMASLAAYYEGGDVDWARKGGGGARPFDVGLVVMALCNLKTSGDVDKANRAIDNLAASRAVGREDAAKLFASDEAIAAEIGRIKAARAPIKFDADAYLAEMDSADDEEEATTE